jgi:amidase/aspartyl-tRNA(Asn)/glutamyl-tRNA(Gln) amidotransferase subunit A
MTTDLTTEQLRELAGTVGLPLGGEATRLAEAVSEELAGYDALPGLAAPRGMDDPVGGVTLDPGPDADPLNAFLATFDPPEPGAGPLDGLEVAVKDNTAVAGVPMTCGSRVFESAVPGRHATVVRRLIEAGAAVVGKTNMDELAYGPTGETSAFGPVANPADREHVAGGSSSGSAAAVAAGEVDAALGSDTGGSVRIPASFCGAVGVKPSWGLVPRTGVVELAYTLDHVGPIARDVRTAAELLDAISGPDPGDPSSGDADRPEGTAVCAVADPPSPGELSVGLPEELFAETEPAVEEQVRGVIADLEAAGATVEPVSVPTVSDAVHVWNAVTNVEFADTLRSGLVPVRRRVALDPTWQDAAAGALAARAGEFGPVVRRKALVGAALLERDGRAYVRARTLCDRLAREFAAALEGRDALLAPTMPVTAPELGAWAAGSYSSGPDVPLAYNTRPADLAGIPAVSVPAGDLEGLPVGLQAVGARHDDHALLGVARALERLIG